MPQMGVSVAEGTVVSWRVAVGERIGPEQTICEISTDKIDTEVPAPVGGVVAEILVPVETTVSVGAVLARIAVGVETLAAGADADADANAGGAGDGDAPALEAAPTDAAATSTSASASTSNGAPDSGATASVEAPGLGGAPRRYSPVVQRIASEHGVDLSRVPGTGRGGRVRKQDVLAFIAEHGELAAGGLGSEPPLHIESPYRPEEAADDGQLSRMRRQIGAHMKRSLDTAAHCTTWIEADMSRVEAARARLGVTALAFVARAVIDSLREHPQLNAWLEGERYSLHDEVNLGIAVSLGADGLIVPVIHRANELSVEGLADRIKELARRARSRSLTPDEVHGGTFTITNPGQYGSIMATPIINQPQVAILDFEAVIKRAVVLSDADGNDSIAIRPLTILGLSWDHRALDGALAAQFLASVKHHLEQPGAG
ncbi:MAG: 2-oxo acid dehydrogenase subunit E2 [Solirubrobacterales bacterium]|nr:2-oxo acid dehydrogenase subunit E2 [Solirubrobacterales bacterium]MBV9473952.1 2-oxo acid dehydrogenase subunit E2 [Solirubrobacterales bacterium]